MKVSFFFAEGFIVVVAVVVVRTGLTSPDRIVREGGLFDSGEGGKGI